MICYMPFTYVEDQYIRKLAKAFGPVSVYLPNPECVPDHMLVCARQGMLELRYPEGVETKPLTRAMREFKLWADLHQGNIADMAVFFKTQKGRPPMFDENNPTSIGDQIRNFGKQGSSEGANPIFQAALFLAMAQEFDQQQDAVTRDLGKIKDMEQDMLARLAGDDLDFQEEVDMQSAPGDSADESDAGAFMTAARVQAWAELVCSHLPQQPFSLFVTASPAVLEHLLDQCAQVKEPFKVPLEMDGHGPGDRDGKFFEALNTLACAEDLSTWSADRFQSRGSGTNGAGLAIYALAGIPPQHFPNRLTATGSKIQRLPLANQGPINTLICLFKG